MADPLTDARLLLERHFGYSEFRAPQERVVQSVLGGRDTLAVLPTGAGKSVCFQVPALTLPGATVVISPLIALMQDQVAGAQRRGIAAESLHSLQSPRHQAAILERLGRGEVKLLYVAPERCRRLGKVLSEGGVAVSLLAVDEAHCISEWGHDFRPAYRALGGFRSRVGWPPAVALTGTATPTVRSDIARALGLGRRGGYDMHLVSFDRRNLWFGVTRVENERDRLRRLLELLSRRDGLAIVYAATRNLSEEVARVLVESGYRAAAYHAGLTKLERRDVLDRFLGDGLDVVAATSAFGLGIDKPNVRLVVHWTLPPSPESYYQEAGRAGRDRAPARCILLYRPGDGELPRRELEVTFPPEKTVERAWRDPGFAATLPRSVQTAIGRLRSELRPSWRKVDWSGVRRRHREALDRIRTVERYAAEGRCRRAALLEYFGQKLPRCAGCDVCDGRGRR
ncbi:MAG: ATP-dependent DNA helicase RecQ [Gemmatimonadota bacterium]